MGWSYVTCFVFEQPQPVSTVSELLTFLIEQGFTMDSHENFLIFNDFGEEEYELDYVETTGMSQGEVWDTLMAWKGLGGSGIWYQWLSVYLNLVPNLQQKLLYFSLSWNGKRQDDLSHQALITELIQKASGFRQLKRVVGYHDCSLDIRNYPNLLYEAGSENGLPVDVYV